MIPENVHQGSRPDEYGGGLDCDGGIEPGGQHPDEMAMVIYHPGQNYYKTILWKNYFVVFLACDLFLPKWRFL